MHTVVTGAAGFIGANLIRALNDRGVTSVLAVDNLARADKFTNLVDCEIAEYVDKDEFLVRLGDGDFDDDIEAVLHQGACSDTMETDGRYMMRNNYSYSVSLLEWWWTTTCRSSTRRASVMAAARPSARARVRRAAQHHGYSKFLFDQYVRGVLPDRTAQIAGFRYFNVYGPREQCKGRMASVAFH